MNASSFMRAYFIALILVAASLSGSIDKSHHEGIFVDCANFQVQMATSSTYEMHDCQMIEYDEHDFNRSKKPNKTGTEERKDEDNDSNSENEENRTREGR